ncbi:septation protein SepH [Mycolicibacterium sp. lyk4-40-TYG-92]|uniref:septation protein SepH n=1 Tax=Mycolicibacterium sp. lyk4-40-TYG-92 TaxID=3040295 RepID=UPI002549D971|nr:septation protein SepH [Mycolicibacterium sp. lyk4-40-TYG-92]
MRELKVVGLDADGKRIICETADTAEKFVVRVDNRLKAAVRGDRAASNQTQIEVEVEVPNSLRPRDIQSRIRAGASVEQLAAASGVSPERIMRFAHPVLLERSRAAELASASHPILPDGPSVLTLLETVTGALISRGLDPEATKWDAWRNEDSRWTVQFGWKAGRSDNVAHFRFSPGAHGGTTTAFDDAATELIDPNYTRPALRSVAPLAQLHFEESVAEIPLPAPQPEPAPAPKPAPAPVVVMTPAQAAPPMPAAPVAPPAPEPIPVPEPAAVVETPEPAAPAARPRKKKPEIPAWEDVLLGVRANGQR